MDLSKHRSEIGTRRDSVLSEGDAPGRRSATAVVQRASSAAPAAIGPARAWTSTVTPVSEDVARAHGLVAFDPGAPAVQLAGERDGSAVHPGAARRTGGTDAGPHLDGDDARAVAASGFATAGTRLPHLDLVQRGFGHHDVSAVRAHVGGAAADASRALGARAYASGDQVAFAREPDLFLAAHEAAHVVQQRGGVQLSGGIGRDGDSHERHADEVAATVVAGGSAEALLDRYSGGGGGPAVQRDPDAAAPAARPRSGDRRGDQVRTRDGQPIRAGDALIPGAARGPGSPDPDTHVTGTGGEARNASRQRRPDGLMESTERFAPEEGSRPPLNPYEGGATDQDTNAPLFDERGPNYDDVQQGQLGDCYLLSALSAVAQMDPARIRRMVSELGDGRFSVTFWVACNEGGIITYNPHQEIVTNEVPVDDQLIRQPVYGGAPPRRAPNGASEPGQRELWVSIVERAYAQWRGGYRDAGNGGSAAIALEEVTGTRSRTFDPRTQDPAEIIVEIEQALRAGAPVTASTRGSGELPDAVAAEHGLFGGHAYSVLHAGGGNLLVRNPHSTPTRGGRRIRVDAEVLRTCFAEVAISGARAGQPVQSQAASEDGAPAS